MRLLLLLLAAAPAVDAAPAPVTVAFSADMRAERAAGRFDPARDRVGVRGGRAPLSWARSVEMVDPDGDGVYAATVTFGGCGGCTPVVAYKFKVERPSSPDDGWEEGGNRRFLLCDGRRREVRAFGSPPAALSHTVAGDLRIHPAFASRHVPARDVFVLLPPGYDRAPRRRYPVLYMHDGQNLFDAATAFSGEWCVDEALPRLVASRAIEPVIVVGVANTDRRIDEYTPTSVTRHEGDHEVRAGGGAAGYGRFLVDELKPFIDRTYRTKSDRPHTALGGSSLGGLVSLVLGLQYPDVFGGLLAVSPSVWWDDEAIVKSVDALTARPATRIWLDVGAAEGEQAVPGARRLRDALAAKGWRVGRDLAYTEAPGAGHDESAWAARVDPMLCFLFPRGEARRGAR